LNYALARWQDPETGRFTSEDPFPRQLILDSESKKYFKDYVRFLEACANAKTEKDREEAQKEKPEYNALEDKLNKYYIENGFQTYVYVKNNPLSYKDALGLFLNITVDRSNQTMTVTYTTKNSPNPQSYTIPIVTAVQPGGDSTVMTDTARVQNSVATQAEPNGTLTHPTQYPSGNFTLTGTTTLPGTATDQTAFGGVNQTLMTNATQVLPTLNLDMTPTGNTVVDTGYFIHITPADYTNGCIGIHYDSAEPGSKQEALSVVMGLISLYTQTLTANGGDGLFSISMVNTTTAPSPTPSPTPSVNTYAPSQSSTPSPTPSVNTYE